MITAHEVAKRAGVSRQTVSFVLNGNWKERRIAAPTHDRVVAAAKQLGYRRNLLARGLRVNKTNTIGLVIRDLDHPEHSALNSRIVRRIEAENFEALVSVVPDLTDTREIQDLFYSHRPEGLILGPLYGALPDSFLRKITAQGFPLVGFEGDQELPFDQVTQDRRVTHVMVINHLTDLGHRRIGFVSLAPDQQYEKTVRELAGNRFGGVYVGHDKFDFDNGLRFAQNLRVGPGEPTAYMMYDTRFAAGFIRGAGDQGIRIPEDVAVVVHGCCEWGKYLPVTLTTIYADLDELTENIVRLLLARIRGNTPGAPQQVRVTPRLKVGESTAGQARGSSQQRQGTGRN